jgi:hypothetical protein
MDGLVSENQLFSITDLYALASIAELHRGHAMMGRDICILGAVTEVNGVVAATTINRVIADITDLEQIVAAATIKRIATTARDKGVVTPAALEQLMRPAAAN